MSRIMSFLTLTKGETSTQGRSSQSLAMSQVCVVTTSPWTPMFSTGSGAELISSPAATSASASSLDASLCGRDRSATWNIPMPSKVMSPWRQKLIALLTRSLCRLFISALRSQPALPSRPPILEGPPIRRKPS